MAAASLTRDPRRSRRPRGIRSSGPAPAPRSSGRACREGCDRRSPAAPRCTRPRAPGDVVADRQDRPRPFRKAGLGQQLTEQQRRQRRGRCRASPRSARRPRAPGATLWAARFSGKLNGAMPSTGPIGNRRTSAALAATPAPARCPGASNFAGAAPGHLRGPPERRGRARAPRPWPTSAACRLSAAIRRAISSARCVTLVETCMSASARTAAGCAPAVTCRAAQAAATACSTCSAVGIAWRPTTEPSYGLTTSATRSLVAGRPAIQKGRGAGAGAGCMGRNDTRLRALVAKSDRSQTTKSGPEWPHGLRIQGLLTAVNHDPVTGRDRVARSVHVPCSQTLALASPLGRTDEPRRRPDHWRTHAPAGAPTGHCHSRSPQHRAAGAPHQGRVRRRRRDPAGVHRCRGRWRAGRRRRQLTDRHGLRDRRHDRGQLGPEGRGERAATGGRVHPYLLHGHPVRVLRRRVRGPQ